MDEQIDNTNIYNETFDCTKCIDRYYNVLVQFTLFINTNLNISNTKKYFIYEKGLTLVNTIYSQIILYTKNIDLAYYNSQKSYYFFIEYINQIEQIENKTLELTINDAIFFVYKKTIFNINQEFRKTFIEKSMNSELIQLKQIFNVLNSIFYSFYTTYTIEEDISKSELFKKNTKSLFKKLNSSNEESIDLGKIYKELQQYMETL